MNLKQKYFKKIVPKLQQIFNYKNKHAVPRIKKLVVNVGINRSIAEKNPKYIDIIVNTLSDITGQQPVKNYAKNSIAGFKIRTSTIVGVSTILRGYKMYDFLNKLIDIALPRIRDFRGIPIKSIDKKGNLSIGIKEQVVFPEIDSEHMQRTHGLQVVITTTNVKNKQEGLELFKLLGFPFKQE